jgi:HK97 family phage prohead protease
MSDYISRGVPITDLEVSGRTVTAYAAVFDVPTEITDGQGHYLETIDRTAFNRTIKGAGAKAGVFYNHGMTIHGTPSESGSIPIGVPTSITADRKGLLTVSRYNGTPMATAVLEAMNEGAIPGYSFTGRIIRSSPDKPPRRRAGSELPTVTRTELGLKEYGPTPFPAYSGAEIVSVRSALMGGHAMMSEDELAEKLLNLLLSRATRVTDPAPSATAPAPGADSDPQEHSERNRILIRDRIARAGVLEWQQPASSATARTADPSSPSEAELPDAPKPSPTA